MAAEDHITVLKMAVMVAVAVRFLQEVMPAGAYPKKVLLEQWEAPVLQQVLVVVARLLVLQVQPETVAMVAKWMEQPMLAVIIAAAAAVAVAIMPVAAVVA